MTIRTIIFLLVLTMPIIATEELDGTFIWTQIELPATDTAEAHAAVAFEYFFRYGSYGVPDNVEVLGVELVDGRLTVDVSEDIANYGGSAFERALAAQLIKIAQELPKTDSFTLLIEGEARPLAQGTEIVAYDLRGAGLHR